MSNVFRALCAELLEALTDQWVGDERPDPEVVIRARAALAAEPESAPESLAVRPLLEMVMGITMGITTLGQIQTIQDRIRGWLDANPPGQPVAIEPRGCPTPGACSCVEAPVPVAEALESAGVFKGAHGLAGLLNADEFWEQQPYGTRLYYGQGIADYLHRDVLRAAVRLMKPLPAPVPKPPVDEGLIDRLTLISDGMSAVGYESDSWFVARAAVLLQQLSAPEPTTPPEAQS